MKRPAVYIMASKKNGTLYTGVTSNLEQRPYQHKEGTGSAFTAKYHCNLLVYYEMFDTMLDAITREKQIKAGSRKKKLALIESINPGWRDLYDDLFLNRHCERSVAIQDISASGLPRRYAPRNDVIGI